MIQSPVDAQQAALDAAFDNSAVPAHAPNKAQVIRRMEQRSLSMRARIGEPQVQAYGDSPVQQVSFYPVPAPTELSPIHVHIHGGAWLQRKAETILFPAEAFLAAGVAFAAIDFTAANEQAGDIRPMVRQVCEGLAWLVRNARALGCDHQRITISGFSSGAQLAGAALAADWTQLGCARTPFLGALLFSGVYDLRAIRRAKPFSYLVIDDAVEQAMSPIHHVERVDTPTVLAVGESEPPEFQRQSTAFAAALKRAGKSVELLSVKGFNHYEMMESFGHPYSELGHAAITLARGG